MTSPPRSLKSRALQLLAQREHSRVELRRKLMVHAKAAAAAVRRDDEEENATAEVRRVSWLPPPERAASRIVSRDEPSGRAAFRIVSPDEPSEEATGLLVSKDKPREEATGLFVSKDEPREEATGLFVSPDESPEEATGLLISPDEPREEARGVVASPDEPPDTAAARVDAVLAWLEANEFVSDQRFAESRVHVRAPRYGNLRLRQELKQHGVALPDDTARLLQDSEWSRALGVWQRRFGQAPQSRAESARQSRFLTARGFSPDVVRRILRARRSGADAETDPDHASAFED